IESGQYRPGLERSYDMSNVVAAHKHAENGHKRGNLALRMIT
ncbi:MAG TPA: NAD(P)-dependent alcohol dehydrogenase, partial [Leptospiraceae bacterium]|nr:NAD(P)-dependent alcohol dehydrogenase [Leptospiraceae bacterium]